MISSATQPKGGIMKRLAILAVAVALVVVGLTTAGAEEAFYLDTFAEPGMDNFTIIMTLSGPKHSSVAHGSVLDQGQDYDVTVKGTCSWWGAPSYGEDRPMFEGGSPTGEFGKVGVDAEYWFTQP